MRKRIAAALENILQTHREREAAARRTRTRERTEEERFRKRWDKKAEGIVVPVFEEFQERLSKQLHICRYKIENVETEAGHSHVGNAVFYVIPKKFAAEVMVEDKTPALTFELDMHRKIVLLSRRTVIGKHGGTDGLNAELEMSQINRKLVEDKLLSLIEDVFAR